MMRASLGGVVSALVLCTAHSSAAQPAPVVLDGHEAGVTSVRFSADGKLLASSDLDGAVRLWRTTDWTPVRTLQHGDEVYSVAFAPDSRILASTGGDRAVVLWDVSTGRRARVLRFPERALAIAFSPSGDLLVGTEDGVVHLVDPGDGRETRALRTGGTVWSIGVSADGKTLATGLPLRVWDYASLAARGAGRSLAQLGIALSRDGAKLASAESTGGALLWTVGDSLTYVPLRMDVEKRALGMRGYERFTVNMPAGGVDISADGRLVAAGSTSADVYVWNFSVSDSAAVAHPTILKGHVMTVTSVAFGRDNLIASGSLDRTVRIWTLGR